MDTPRLSEQALEIAEAIGRAADGRRLTVAVAESLTSGQIACHLGAASSSSEWFKGGVVAYANAVKFDVLGVPTGPVVTEDCARAMAEGVRRLLDADVALAVTGVGGPTEEEHLPPGHVHLAVAGDGAARAEHHRFDGDPQQILAATTQSALRMLHEHLDSLVPQ